MLLSLGSKALYAYEPNTGLSCRRVEDPRAPTRRQRDPVSSARTWSTSTPATASPKLCGR
jgi:hypothetical protein